MVRFVEKYRAVIGALALVLTTLAVNSTCAFTLYQEEIPDQAKKLRKF